MDIQKSMHLRTIFFLFCQLVCVQHADAQGYSYWNRCGDYFDARPYPADTFAVKQQEYTWGTSRVVLTVLRHKILQEDQVWLEQTYNGNPFRGKYLWRHRK
ncbi:MAG: hypothetical protein IT270_15750 [Saprospiraceae bacterium]|nr:hypothetical protein [Saprospiraceae bacterium]